MCVLLITRLLRGVGRWTRKPVNHTSWVAIATPIDRLKSVRNRCLINFFCGVVCVVALPFWHFGWCTGFCQKTGSDLLLFVFVLYAYTISFFFQMVEYCYWSNTWLRFATTEYISTVLQFKPHLSACYIGVSQIPSITTDHAPSSSVEHLQ